jgi:3-methylfumaryl-CoA hydratase
MALIDIDHLRTWVGNTETLDDVATLAPLRALTAALDRDDPLANPGDAIPPCWHWLYFLPAARQSEIGLDGHPQRGGFLPPVPLPRRMWAGSRIDCLAPLRVGQSIERTSRIDDVRLKEGKTGPLVFVKVRHEIRSDRELAIVEEHDIVFRGMQAPDDPAPIYALAPEGAEWSRVVVPDEVLLFRYSALTFNGHRIHYDRRYVTEVEGYPGLIVHGPLIATLLLDLLRRERPTAVVTRFVFRAMKPLFDIAPFTVSGRIGDANTVALWARDADGHLAMDATATLA